MIILECVYYSHKRIKLSTNNITELYFNQHDKFINSIVMHISETMTSDLTNVNHYWACANAGLVKKKYVSILNKFFRMLSYPPTVKSWNSDKGKVRCYYNYCLKYARHNRINMFKIMFSEKILDEYLSMLEIIKTTKSVN